jgi:hypothetical protein
MLLWTLSLGYVSNVFKAEDFPKFYDSILIIEKLITSKFIVNRSGVYRYFYDLCENG